ncbi:RraA family protein [soil metagenome]
MLARFRNTRAAVVSDILDGLGLRAQTIHPGISRLSGPTPLVGRAATLTVVAVDGVPEVPYATQFEALEMLEPGEVMVVAAPPDVPAAFWGELLTTRLIARGCAGAVIDGYTRDIEAICDYDFPLWARGTHPADSAGRLDAVEIRKPIECGGVTVTSGDIVVADGDGATFVPAHLAAQVVELAEIKAAKEDKVREALRGGERVQDVYARIGVM